MYRNSDSLLAYTDVQDLAWSSDNQYLASCAVDGHVIVWDGLTFGTRSSSLANQYALTN